MKLLRRTLLMLIVLVACVGCDQSTKTMARSYLAHRAILSYLHDTVRLQLAFNSGGFLSLGASLPDKWRTLMFIAATGFLLLCLLGYALVFKPIHYTALVALTLVLAGGVSNLMDRIRLDGRVVDFMNIGIGPLRSGIFNVADLAIMAGIILLIGNTLSARKSDRGA